jgi:hypothetical protein
VNAVIRPQLPADPLERRSPEFIAALGAYLDKIKKD